MRANVEFGMKPTSFQLPECNQMNDIDNIEHNGLTVAGNGNEPLWLDFQDVLVSFYFLQKAQIALWVT